MRAVGCCQVGKTMRTTRYLLFYVQGWPGTEQGCFFHGGYIVEAKIHNRSAESSKCYKEYSAGQRSQHYSRTLVINVIS